MNPIRRVRNGCAPTAQQRTWIIGALELVTVLARQIQEIDERQRIQRQVYRSHIHMRCKKLRGGSVRAVHAGVAGEFKINRRSQRTRRELYLQLPRTHNAVGFVLWIWAERRAIAICKAIYIDCHCVGSAGI